MNGALVTGFFALGGVLLTYAGQTVTTERTRRENRTERWADRRYAAVARFLAIADAWDDAARQALLRAPDDYTVKTLAWRQEALEAAAEIELLCTPAVAAAAHSWRDSLFWLWLSTDAETDEHPADRHNAARGKLKKEREAFLAAARADLGVLTRHVGRDRVMTRSDGC